MHRTLLLPILIAAACGTSSSDAPKPYTNAKPAFTLDLPAGYQAAEPLENGAHGMLRFDGPHASDFLMVSWDPVNDETATQARDSLAQSAKDTGDQVTGQGDAPGGAAWMTIKNTGGENIEAFLVAGDQLLNCQANGHPAVVEACKTLRLK
jgi:hypothetical protein